MPLTAENIENIVRRLVAVNQRLSEIQEIGQLLLRPNVWRSADGTVGIGALTAADKTKLRARITDVLDEVDLISAALRSYLGPSP